MTAQICVQISLVSGEVPSYVKVYSKHSQHKLSEDFYFSIIPITGIPLSHKPIS